MTPEPSFEHVARMTDQYGTYEHADGTAPRPEHGYCTDDMARVLVVTTRQPSPSRLVSDLARQALRFVAEAQSARGDCRNRRDRRGQWQGPYEVGDAWGRSLWGLGTAAARSPNELVRQVALGHFERGARQRSRSPRAMAFAALGAHEILAAYPGHGGALDLLAGTVGVVGIGATSTSWSWPEPRLSYANAALPEALIVAGAGLDRPELVHHGLHLLGWLLDHETAGGHLSVAPVGGCGPDDPRPGFDQQPIEVAALADACSRAAALTGDDRWAAGVASAVAWFLGDNDAQAPMWDPCSGGGYDGLRADGPNLNQGAESTLSLISTLQHGRSLVGAGR
ncbi:MAG: glycosyltransferase [Acidimicrobiales bacterium]